MQLVLFWIFSLLMLLSAMGVVFFRNPVSSAMSLVLSFIALAAVFVTLDAFFIAVVQVLVYAGAVMVLFLFHPTNQGSQNFCLLKCCFHHLQV